MNLENQNTSNNDKYIVPALERGLRILQEFGRDNNAIAAPEIAHRLNLPRATVFRLLNTLETMGFLQRTESGNAYRLGFAVLRLGFEFLAALDLTELGQPIIKNLSDLLGLSCSIVVRDGRSIVYVAKVTSSTPFSSSIRVGARLPAHATVLGHILLSDINLPELRDLYPEKNLEIYTKHTPKTVDELFAQIQLSKEKGYVVSEGFFENAICTVAAPVRDSSGQIVAALGANLAAANFTAQLRSLTVAGVCAAADELSDLLNYRANKAQSSPLAKQGIKNA